MQCLNEGKSILVCAPTGSGKTAIAEFAIQLALANNKRIFYTTPLKALSNQKFYDLGKAFGEDRVGLLTGDIQINREAEILVLTTEIFRNMLYKSNQEQELFSRMGFLVLDECHYMQDADRGTVWEESIIYCPAQAQIIGLSATIGNPEQLTAWINTVHNNTELIQSDKRPVPLRFFFFGRDGFKSLKNQQGKINPKIFKTGGSRRGGGLPTMTETLAELKQREMLPAIYFLFSRKGCEEAMKRTANSNLHFLSEEEDRLLRAELERATLELPWLKEHPHLHSLKKGVAAHHAGLLPALKSLVERLFQKNLLKVVFATETLAAGINMPARAVVISQISKRTDSGHRLLSGSEFMQMGGRAGRRGMDEVGYVVVLETRFEGAMEVGVLASTGAESLHSAFTPNYVMILNLAGRHTWDQCRDIVLQSFARFEKQKDIHDLRNTIEQLESNLSRKIKDEKQSEKKQKRLQKVGGELSKLEAIPWPEFERGARILQHYNYLDSDLKPTTKGTWAADLRGDNILFLGEIIASGILDDLTSYELAGFACAMGSFEVRWEDSRNPYGWAITEDIEKATKAAYEKVRDISHVQSHFDLEMRIPFTPSLIELGFDWASEYDWGELVDKFRADEGDLVKALKQGSDLLKQIAACAGSSDNLKNNAGQAFNLVFRSPIKDELL